MFYFVFDSFSQTPGEGEHKVMDFIRYSKSQADYDPDTRHCLYGLDADLVRIPLIFSATFLLPPETEVLWSC